MTQLPSPGIGRPDFGDGSLKRVDLGGALKDPKIGKSLAPLMADGEETHPPKILYAAPTFGGHKWAIPSWMNYVAQDGGYHQKSGWECEGLLVFTDDWVDARRTLAAAAPKRCPVKIEGLSIDTPRRQATDGHIAYNIRKIAAQRQRCIEYARDGNFDGLYWLDDDVTPKGAPPNDARPGPSAFRLYKWGIYADVGISTAIVPLRLNADIRRRVAERGGGRKSVNIRSPATTAGQEQALDVDCDYVEVDSIGLGCCMVFSRAFGTIDMPQPEEFPEYGTKGEDIAYSTKVRMTGLQIIADKRVRAWHFENEGRKIRAV